MFLVRVISAILDSASRRIVKVRVLGSDTQTGLEALPYGTDSNPIKDMVAVYAPTLQKGKTVVIGYINKNQLAAIGEHRIYSTDEQGNLKFSIWLKNDGTCEIGGTVGHLTRFEQLEIGFNKFVLDFNNHVHSGNGVPPLVPTTAEISTAKINELKTI